MSKLVIVESPAKAKTIRKYLGGGYEVTASMGHIRDLPQSQLGIDVEHGYAPQYINIKGKEKIIKELKSLAKESDEVFLATDPDREGEAISWHLANLLGLDTAAENRVTFGEITKKGVTQGMAAPRAIDMDLFNAQQARRVLDRLVGYKLSPFLWKKVRRGLSAGRVQSVAVRLIVDREKEIEAFKPEEYWNIDALLSPPSSTKKFTARLTALAGGRKLAVTSAGQSAEIVKALDGAAYTVASISKGKRKKVPAPPFITSTMQQEASRRLGFTATRTMRAAQTLYEGVDIAGQGTMGLITYMRTDSLRIADEAQAAAKEFITETYGPEYVCPQKRTYKSKSATAAQDAHEAVRPTNPALTPAEVEKSVSGDPAKLYRLIWSRFIASQMSDCQQDTVSADITAAGYLFRASGYVVTFDGFTTLYEEATDEKEKKETALPPLEEGMVLKLRELKPEQKFTQPPARYTEATLIKALEENGIGRPSTYAPIITTIIDRDYVERQQKKLVPTRLGRAIDELMEAEFPGLPGLPRMQKHQAPCEGHRRPVPQVRQPHAGAPFQKGPCVLRLREKPHLRLYDMERAHHRKMPGVRFHPVQKGRKERYPAVRKRGLRLLPCAGCRKKGVRACTSGSWARASRDARPRCISRAAATPWNCGSKSRINFPPRIKTRISRSLCAPIPSRPTGWIPPPAC